MEKSHKLLSWLSGKWKNHPNICLKCKLEKLLKFLSKLCEN